MTELEVTMSGECTALPNSRTCNGTGVLLETFVGPGANCTEKQPLVPDEFFEFGTCVMNTDKYVECVDLDVVTMEAYSDAACTTMTAAPSYPLMACRVTQTGSVKMLGRH